MVFVDGSVSHVLASETPSSSFNSASTPPTFLFIDDNAPPHHARIVTARLQEVGVPGKVWPIIYPDLSPVEHVWNKLKQRLDGRILPQRDLADLRVALVEKWNSLPQNIMKLVRSVVKFSLQQRGETPGTDIVNFSYMGLLLSKFGDNKY